MTPRLTDDGRRPEVRPAPDQHLGAQWPATVAGALRLTPGRGRPDACRRRPKSCVGWTRSCRGSPTTPSSTTCRRAGWSSSPAAPGVPATSARDRSVLLDRAGPRRRLRDVAAAAVPRPERPRRLAAGVRLPARHSPSRPAGDAHGDVVYWPLLALGDYLRRHRRRHVPSPRGAVRRGRRAHRAGAAAGPPATGPSTAIESRRASPARALPAYGHGDWNDSLQPADPAPRGRASCSTWTVVLPGPALRPLADGLEALDAPDDLADRAAAGPGEPDASPTRGRRDRATSSLVDGVLPGYVLLDDDGWSEPLVHPRDDPHRADLRRAADDPRDLRRPAHARTRPGTTST